MIGTAIAGFLFATQDDVGNWPMMVDLGWNMNWYLGKFKTDLTFMPTEIATAYRALYDNFEIVANLVN